MGYMQFVDTGGLRHSYKLTAVNRVVTPLHNLDGTIEISKDGQKSHGEGDPTIVKFRSSRNSIAKRPEVLSASLTPRYCTVGGSGMNRRVLLSNTTRGTPSSTVLIEADEPHYRQAFERMLCALEQVSGRVEGAELGVAYVGLDGLDGPAAGRDDLLGAVPEHFRPRIGIGANMFTSLVAARARRSPGATIVPGDAAAFLAPHPIGLLPCSSGLLDDLRRLGLRSLGDVAAQEPHALLERFGREGRRAWELASGIDERPLRPRAHEEPVTERLALPEASVSLELLRAAVEMLLARAFVQPRMQGREAGSATLSCELEDGPTWSREFHFRSILAL